MSSLSQSILILVIVICVLGIFLLLYAIAAFRRMLIVTKKLDYLIEDFTYKAEMLNPAIETISRMTGYIDAFDVVAKRNIESVIKYISRNRDTIYKMSDKVKEFTKKKMNIK